MSGELAVRVTLSEIEKMADYVVKSKLFGINKREEAVGLMLLAQAEGMHPMRAVQEYHIIQGRPAMRADAMLARFLQAGGKVTWHELSDQKCSATFEHPQGGKATITWTLEDAKRAGLLSKAGSNWAKYPRQMLRSRVVSEGVRTVYPGVATGIYVPEEVVAFDDAEDATPTPVKPEAVDVEAKPIPQASEPGPKKATSPQLTKVMVQFKELGLDSKDDRSLRLALSSMVIGRDLESSKDMTAEDASALIEYLDALQKALVEAGVKDAVESRELIRGLVEAGIKPDPEDVEALKQDLNILRDELGRQELIPEEAE